MSLALGLVARISDIGYEGRHPIWYSPVSSRNFPVPVNIISRHTANAVLRQAGLEKQF